MVQPSDIAAAEELCAKRGGYARSTLGTRRGVDVNCMTATPTGTCVCQKGVTMPDTHITIPMARLMELEAAEQRRATSSDRAFDLALLVAD